MLTMGSRSCSPLGHRENVLETFLTFSGKVKFQKNLLVSKATGMSYILSLPPGFAPSLQPELILQVVLSLACL